MAEADNTYINSTGPWCSQPGGHRQDLLKEGHSDVHLGVGEVPRYRARGEMQSTEWPATGLSTFQGWLIEILSPQQIDALFREKEFDGSHAFPFVRIRINLLIRCEARRWCCG